MSFYQNPIGEEFRQSWPIDQQARFSIPANLNNIAELLSGNAEPYDFSVVNTFTINIAYDPAKIGYTAIAVNVAGASPAATTAIEVVTALNSNALFADNFTASIVNATKGSTGNGTPFKVLLRCTKPRVQARIYVTNAGAEQKLRFNYQAQVREFPTYFDRYTIANRFVFPDGPSLLVALNPGDPVDAAVITAAGLNPLVVQADYQLLAGRSNTHTFSKLTYDGSSRLINVVEYFAGAVVGDLAKRTQYTYTGAATSPDQITTVPYTLTSGDLVTPP
jgi:YD repeat-containing protein